MKIGNHIGKRAKINDNLGYFFETIEMSEHNLFVYDSKIGHSALPYFENHQNEWNDELKKRCWLIKPEYVTLVKPLVKPKIIL